MSFQIIPIIVVFINICLGIFVYSNGPNVLSNKVFSLLCFLIALWDTSNLLADTFVSIFWLQTTFSLGALLISTGLVWVQIISNELPSRKKIYAIISIGILFALVSYLPNFITEYINGTNSKDIFAGSSGLGLIIYALFYFTYSFLILRKLYRGSTANNNEKKRSQLKSILIGTIAVLIVIGTTSFVMPYFFSSFVSSTFDSLGLLIFVIFLTYTITKHHLFSIKVIAIELVTFGLWVVILGRLLVSTTTTEMLLAGSILVVTIIFGIMIIRSTLHEIEQREHINKLTIDLQKAYKTLDTKDVPERI